MSRSFSISFVVVTIILFAIVNVNNSQRIECNRPYEEYDCGSACQTECSTLGEPCPIINIKCNDACYCIKGYARNEAGNCIPIAQCPPKTNCKK